MFVGSADLRSLRASPPETARHALLNENLPRPLGILSCAQRKIPPRCRPHIFPLINTRQTPDDWLTRHHWQRLTQVTIGWPTFRSTCSLGTLQTAPGRRWQQPAAGNWPGAAVCSVGRFSWFGRARVSFKGSIVLIDPTPPPTFTGQPFMIYVKDFVIDRLTRDL